MKRADKQTMLVQHFADCNGISPFHDFAQEYIDELNQMNDLEFQEEWRQCKDDILDD
jgi:hypothetical protein